MRFRAQARELAPGVIVTGKREVANPKLVAGAGQLGIKGERRLKFRRRTCEAIVLFEFVALSNVSLSGGLVS
jgi:hypothetical protein